MCELTVFLLLWTVPLYADIVDVETMYTTVTSDH